MLQEISSVIKFNQCYGVELDSNSVQKAQKKGIKILDSDLNKKLKIKSNSIDILVSTHVIEHVDDIDIFISEAYRILKPGGLCLISTVNGSGWINIIVSIFGWQIFPSTNISIKTMGLGNPIAIHRGEVQINPLSRHKVIFYYRGLKELFNVYGFKNIRVIGSGYYPLPSILGKFDPVHANYITCCGIKNSTS